MCVLGALNTVGRYIVNMTRGQETPITHNNDYPSENVPNAILTLTKNVLGQNVTKTIEPMIKRFSVVETRDDPSLLTSSSTLLPPLVELSTATAVAQLHSIDAKKKKIKTKTKRKDQLQVNTERVQLESLQSITENRKISIF